MSTRDDDGNPGEAAFDEDLVELIGATHFGVLAYWVYGDSPDWPRTEPRPVMPGMGLGGVIDVGYA